MKIQRSYLSLPPVQRNEQRSKDRFNDDFYRLFNSNTVDDERPKQSEQSKKYELDRSAKLLHCFYALLNSPVAEYQDDSIQVKLLSQGRLIWRLISGPLEGTTLYAKWQHHCIELEFMMIDRRSYQRISQLQSWLSQQLHKKNPTFEITFKVSYAAYY